MKDQKTRQIHNFMKSLDFSSNEITIYLSLLENGISNIARLSKRTKIPRTTIVRNIEKLQERGLVTKGVESSESILIAENPSKLKSLIRENELHAEKLLNKYKDLGANLPVIENYIKEIAPNDGTNGNVSLKYYEGIKGVQGAYNVVINANPEKLYTFLNADNYFNVFPEIHDLFKNFLNKSKKAEIYEIIVGSTSSVSDKLRDAIADIGNRCECRFGTSDIVFSDFDFLLYDDTVLMIHINQDLPMGILIKSSAIVNGLKGMHQMLWKHLEKIN